MIKMWKLFLLMLLHYASCKCPDEFVRIKSKCYYFSRSPEPWNDAHFKCTERNSTLAVLRGKYQSEALRNHMVKFHINDQEERWIGGIYDWQERSWKWGVTGNKVDYRGFSRLEKADLKWNCIVIDPKVQFKWNARQCFESKHYICQTDSRNQNKKNRPSLSTKRQCCKGNNSTIGDASPGHLKAKPNKKVPITKKLRNLACPKNFIKIRKHCYFFSTTTAPWQEAFFECKDTYNASLAVIDTLKDDMQIVNNVNRYYIPYVDRWIGGKYDWKQRIWIWDISGRRIPYQPTEKRDMAWHCLSWNPKVKQRPRWDSDSCFMRKHFICQTPVIHVFQAPAAKKGKLDIMVEFGINGKILRRKTYRAIENETGRKVIFRQISNIPSRQI